jgi:threonine dehydratase
MRLVSLEDIRAAAANVAGAVVHTPLLSTPGWPSFFVKPECLQPTGAFKLRGAFNAVAKLPAQLRAAGVATDSSGNHGQALAYTARQFGIACVVVMPDVAPPFKIDAVRALGAEVVLVPPSERNSRLKEVAAVRGLVEIPPFDHADIIAGQATIGLEIVEDCPEVACVLVPVGGGGLASGIASAIKALCPAAVVVGVEPELAGDAAESLRLGHVAQWSTDVTYRTVADGLRVGSLSDLTFAHLRTRLDGIVTVTEAEIKSTVGDIVRGLRIVAEPSGAVATAAWLHHREELRDRFAVPDGPVVSIVSGGNLSPAALAELLA